MEKQFFDKLAQIRAILTKIGTKIRTLRFLSINMSCDTSFSFISFKARAIWLKNYTFAKLAQKVAKFCMNWHKITA